MYSGNVQQNPSCVGSCHNESSRLSPVLACDFLLRCKFRTPTSTSLYSSINRLYAQDPGFEIVREESVKVYLHMHNGNVQQNPICVESCVTKEFSISPLLSPAMFDPDANSVLLRAKGECCTLRYRNDITRANQKPLLYITRTNHLAHLAVFDIVINLRRP